jgi:hypothetical protein
VSGKKYGHSVVRFHVQCLGIVKLNNVLWSKVIERHTGVVIKGLSCIELTKLGALPYRSLHFSQIVPIWSPVGLGCNVHSGQCRGTAELKVSKLWLRDQVMVDCEVRRSSRRIGSSTLRPIGRRETEG